MPPPDKALSINIIIKEQQNAKNFLYKKHKFENKLRQNLFNIYNAYKGENLMQRARHLEISSFIPPPNGRRIHNGLLIWDEDFRTLERYQEYKDCGFTEIMFAGEDRYLGEPFETSEIKKMLDMAHQVGLKAILVDKRIMHVSLKAVSSPLNEFFKGDEKAFSDFIADCIKDYQNHPAFYGVAIVDEPVIEKAGIVTELTKAIKTANPKVFVHTCFLPMDWTYGESNERSLYFFGKGYKDCWDSYGNYVDVMCKTNVGYYGYDWYPLGFDDYKNKISTVSPFYVGAMQFSKGITAKNGLPFHMTIQSYSTGANMDIRHTYECDFNWQTNLCLGFGAEKIYYYTYWRWRIRYDDNVNDHSAIMDDDGTKMMYDDVQKNNAYAKRVYEYLCDYDYVASKVLKTDIHEQCLDGVKETDFGFITDYKAIAPVLINKMSGDKGDIYMVMNMRDPYFKNDVNSVELKMENPKSEYDVIVDGYLTKVKCDDGYLKFDLKAGQAVFVLG